MAKLAFREISFLDKKDSIRGLFLGRYYFDIQKEDLEPIGVVQVKDGALVFQGVDDNYAWKRFDPILDKAFDNLFHINYNKPTVYIHKDSGIPLIGTNEFGIVDRGSNTIEIKPMTGCNFQCPFCSVDEGKNNKTHDYIVDWEYLVEVAKDVARIKKNPVEFHIGPQGEPLLYPQFVELVRGLKKIPRCKYVTVVTNGSLLTEQLIDQLHEAGLDKINLSLNALTQETADMMSGRKYPLEQVLRMIKYCEGKIMVILAPTVVPGMNDAELDSLVQLGTTIKHDLPSMGLQNYLNYKRGRNPVEQRTFDEFFSMLKPLEKKHDMKLTEFTAEEFGIFDEPELEKPFKKRDVIKARVACPARYPNEVIMVASDRCITVKGPRAHELPVGREMKVQLIRDKHNIFKGVLV